MKMQRQELLQIFFLSTFFVVGKTRTVPQPAQTEVPKNSTPCSIDVGQLCQEVEEDHSDYAIKIGTHFFEHSSELQVKVYLASCPWHIKESPWWYQLTALVKEPEDIAGSGASKSVIAHQPIEKRTETENIGGFIPITLNQEIHLCDSNKRTVYTSCSPSPMDFPMMFIWKGSTEYNESDSICFKLLLKQDDHTACKVVQECHTVSELLSNSSSDPSLITEHVSSSAASLEEILSHTSRSSSVSNTMEDILNTNLTSSSTNSMSITGCMSTKKFLHDSGFSWEPSCDCKGNYKSVQCRRAEIDSQVCWCSTPGGSEKFNTRRTLTCDSAMQFEC